MRKLNLALQTIIAASLLLCAATVRGGSDIYFVTYNHYIDKGELELMLMNDFTDPSKFRRKEDGQHSYFSQMIELEYGVTEQWATEFMIEGFQEPGTGQSRFTGFRFENRYRLFKQEVPLNPMLYVEYEDLDPATRYKMEVSGWVRPPYKDNGGEPDRERILESRLILSQDFGRLNVAFNWISESDLNASGFTAFGYALGTRYDFNGGHFTNPEPDEHAGHHGQHGKHALLKPTLGLELYGGVGDTRRLDFNPSRQEHYLQPDIMLHLSEHTMLHLGFAMGLSKASDNLVRTALAIEF